MGPAVGFSTDFKGLLKELNKNYLKTEILELKTITDTKVLLHGLKSRLETAGERTSEAEDKSVTMT